MYSRTKSADGKATITILLDPEAEDKPGLVRKNVGRALLKLRKLEEKLLEGLDGVTEKEKELNSLISHM